jgi:hypothetical protein
MWPSTGIVLPTTGGSRGSREYRRCRRKPMAVTAPTSARCDSWSIACRFGIAIVAGSGGDARDAGRLYNFNLSRSAVATLNTPIRPWRMGPGAPRGARPRIDPANRCDAIAICNVRSSGADPLVGRDCNVLLLRPEDRPAETWRFWIGCCLVGEQIDHGM